MSADLTATICNAVRVVVMAVQTILQNLTGKEMS